MTLNLAPIGAGRIAKVHAGAIAVKPSAGLAAVADALPAAAASEAFANLDWRRRRKAAPVLLGYRASDRRRSLSAIAKRNTSTLSAIATLVSSV